MGKQVRNLFRALPTANIFRFRVFLTIFTGISTPGAAHAAVTAHFGLLDYAPVLCTSRQHDIHAYVSRFDICYYG